LEHYLAHVALFSNSDLENKADKVKMMTVHAAKGLEFPYLFVCGLNEGIFPSSKVKNLPCMEEERRLAFVAMTRAKKALFLTESEGRNLDGSPRYPSRFILDIDENLLEYTTPPNQGLIKTARNMIRLSDKWLDKEAQKSTFKVGQRVKHNIFGEGIVVDIDLQKGAHIVKFDKIGTPRAISFKAKLEAEET
ncbi:MAG: 3'-5' exonuclease, partial [Lachnospiraceae bacterium]